MLRTRHFHCSMLGAWVRSLVGELRSHKPCSQKKKRLRGSPKAQNLEWMHCKLWSEQAMLGQGPWAGDHHLLPHLSLQQLKERDLRTAGRPETLLPGRGVCKAKTLFIIILRCYLSFLLLFSQESTGAFTRVGCSRGVGYHDRLNAEAGVRIHLSSRKPGIQGICKCQIMPLIP